MKRIPNVKTWKITAVESGRVVYIDTINMKFARYIARTEFRMYGQTLRISLSKQS